MQLVSPSLIGETGLADLSKVAHPHDAVGC